MFIFVTPREKFCFVLDDNGFHDPPRIIVFHVFGQTTLFPFDFLDFKRGLRACSWEGGNHLLDYGNFLRVQFKTRNVLHGLFFLRLNAEDKSRCTLFNGSWFSHPQLLAIKVHLNKGFLKAQTTQSLYKDQALTQQLVQNECTIASGPPRQAIAHCLSFLRHVNSFLFETAFLEISNVLNEGEFNFLMSTSTYNWTQ